MENKLEKKYIFFFKDDKSQIKFEFTYLLVLLAMCSLALFVLYIIPIEYFNTSSKKYLYSIIGAFMGGWAYDAKWFYRVTAKGKDNQYKTGWEPNKFYWRILTPFLSSIVGFAFYIIVISRIIPFIVINSNSNTTALGFSFIFGYFSDMAIGKMSDWVCKILGNKEEPSNNEKGK